tara:strand:- start:7514 stop:8191 length:678 start_codon:yes stop_codon:yes gene_type:complete
MLIKPVLALPCALLLLSGCAEFAAWSSSLGAPAAAPPARATANPLYLAQNAPAEVATYRTVYIAPANLANMQVIQPEGARTDPEWWVTEGEDTLLQRAIAHEFTMALTYGLDFIIVNSPQQAQLVVNTAVVAVHPDATRASVARAGTPGGSITVSLAVIDAANDTVLLRSVDTRASEDIWAFNEVSGEDPAINRVFASWGADLRRGILDLQGRSDDTPIPPAVQY